jgi:hypothetical protein
MKSTVKCDSVTGMKKCTLTNIHVANDSNDEEENHLPISEFDLNTMVKDPAISIIGKRECGKSWLIKDFIHKWLNAHKISEVLVISPQDKISNFYSKFIENVQHYYNPKLIEIILKKQKVNIENGIENKYLVVFDDCFVSKGSWVKDQATQELLLNGRHYNISYIFSMQIPLGITPELRSNFDYNVLFKDDIISNLKRMYDHYAGVFPTFKSFKMVYDQLTDDYGAMIIVNRGSKKSIFEKIHWYRAQEVLENFYVQCILNSFDIGVVYSNEKVPKKVNSYVKKIKTFDTFNNYTISQPELLADNMWNDNISQPELLADDTWNDNIYQPKLLAGDEFDNYINNMPVVPSPIYFGGKNNNIKNETSTHDHVKKDTLSKNKYDVLFQIIKCNEEIIKTNSSLLSSSVLNTIIQSNLEIAKMCETKKQNNVYPSTSNNSLDNGLVEKYKTCDTDMKYMYEIESVKSE